MSQLFAEWLKSGQDHWNVPRRTQASIEAAQQPMLALTTDKENPDGSRGQPWASQSGV